MILLALNKKNIQLKTVDILQFISLCLCLYGTYILLICAEVILKLFMQWIYAGLTHPHMLSIIWSFINMSYNI